MNQSLFLLVVPIFLCVSCTKSQTSVLLPAPAQTAVAAPSGPQFAASAAKVETGPYQKPTVPGAIHLEAEDGALTGNTVKTEMPGYSGKGYAGELPGRRRQNLLQPGAAMRLFAALFCCEL